MAERSLLSVAHDLQEFCPSCGEDVNPLHFNYNTGWCNECTGTIDRQPRCTHCGDVLPDVHRTTCPTCRQERWLQQHADELEYLVVAKGYTLSHARLVLAKMVRPICKHCGKPIAGAKDGALFHKDRKPCHSQYNKFRRLRKKGYSVESALAALVRR